MTPQEQIDLLPEGWEHLTPLEVNKLKPWQVQYAVLAAMEDLKRQRRKVEQETQRIAYEAAAPQREAARLEFEETQRRLREEQAAQDEATRQERLPRFQAMREQFTRNQLARCGMPLRVLDAREDLVTPAIRDAVGNREKFGIVGTTGCGKTFAVAARLRAKTEALVDEAMTARIEAPRGLLDRNWDTLTLHGRFVWTDWPTEIRNARSKVFAQGGDSVEAWIQNDLLDHRSLLVLDDVGLDRAVGNDWAGEQLGRVIRARHLNDAPTIWTSNLNTAQLIDRYGAALVSRLIELAPPIHLPTGLPDRRVAAWQQRATREP